ncbi:MAG: sigma-70 family RNA polymerase sigma factor [Gemmataceae bacterium]|nr:sigma-70 family RNA polymerase sigma factor [Gemmataceae bacterium]
MAEPDFVTTDLHSLLDRVRSGEEDARDAIYRRISGRLENLCRKMLRTQPSVRQFEETADVMQNVSIRLLRTLETARPGSIRELYALATELVRCEILDLLRHHLAQRRTPAEGKRAVRCEPESVAQQPEAEELDRWHAFHENVARLSTLEREVFGLVYYHGWSQKEIAELFQVNERTIRRRWHAACLSLKRQLGDQMPSTSSTE